MNDFDQIGRGRATGMTPLGVYVHIPFCVKKCPYCDFASGPVGLAQRRAYVDRLLREIRSSPWRGAPAQTLFLGGGTPSELTLEECREIISALTETFTFLPGSEWTLECNPGTVRPPKLEVLRRLGFNRISLGIQSLVDRHLLTLGRIHNAQEAREAIPWVRQAGFDNLNLDLIFGIPGQTIEEWLSDLEEVFSMAAEHLSLYSLTVEPDTEFGKRAAAGEVLEADEETAARMFEVAMERTQRAGFHQYEISNYALPGQECRHNLIYWKNSPFLGFGVSAASYVDGVRWANTRSLTEYVVSQSLPVPRQYEEKLEAEQALGEKLMLRLRLIEGFSLSDESFDAQSDLEAMFAPALTRLQNEGLLVRDKDRIRLSPQGILLADRVCTEFLR